QILRPPFRLIPAMRAIGIHQSLEGARFGNQDRLGRFLSRSWECNEHKKQAKKEECSHGSLPKRNSSDWTISGQPPKMPATWPPTFLHLIPYLCMVCGADLKLAANFHTNPISCRALDRQLFCA